MVSFEVQENECKKSKGCNNRESYIIGDCDDAWEKNMK